MRYEAECTNHGVISDGGPTFPPQDISFEMRQLRVKPFILRMASSALPFDARESMRLSRRLNLTVFAFFRDFTVAFFKATIDSSEGYLQGHLLKCVSSRT